MDFQRRCLDTFVSRCCYRTVEKEGGTFPRDANIHAACNYIRTAILSHQRGVTCKGPPFVKWSSWTRRYTFLYIEDGFQETFSSKLTETQKFGILPPQASLLNKPVPSSVAAPPVPLMDEAVRTGKSSRRVAFAEPPPTTPVPLLAPALAEATPTTPVPVPAPLELPAGDPAHAATPETKPPGLPLAEDNPKLGKARGRKQTPEHPEAGQASKARRTGSIDKAAGTEEESPLKNKASLEKRIHT